MIRFDFDDRYQDDLVVGSAISRREGFVWSVVVHVVGIVLLVQAARVVVALQRQEPDPEPEQQVARLERPDDTRVVFMNPLVEKPPAQPRQRPELSDLDRRAETRQRPEAPQNPLPFAEGNTPERVEAAPPPDEARAEEAPPPPPDPLPRPESPIARTSPVPPGPARAPDPPRPRNPRVLEGAIRNPQPFLSRDAFDNPQGGDLDTSSSFQFDSKGVDFGSWLRRFKLQVTGNWLPFIPRSAMVNHGNVFLQFYVHRDGTISDVQILRPSEFIEFTRVADGAIRLSNPTAPLPAEYPDDKMLMRVGFFYNERPPN